MEDSTDEDACDTPVPIVATQVDCDENDLQTDSNADACIVPSSESTTESAPVEVKESPSCPTQIPSTVKDHIHAYVDEWYEANKDGIDLGRINLPFIGDVDIFPDSREKAIYRKLFTLAITNLLQVEIKFAGVPMRLTMVDDEPNAKEPEDSDESEGE